MTKREAPDQVGRQAKARRRRGVDDWIWIAEFLQRGMAHRSVWAPKSWRRVVKRLESLRVRGKYGSLAEILKGRAVRGG